MHYLLTVIGDTSNDVDDSAPGAVDDLQRQLRANGQWVFGGGLTSPIDATVADNRGGEVVFTDGPFVESKEYLGGFWVIEAADLDVALELAAGGSKACHRKVEVRPFDGTRMTETSTTRSPVPTARSGRGWSPASPAASATWTSPRRRLPRRTPLPSSGGRRDGVPPNPGAWLTTTATRKAIDRIRREAKRGAKHEAGRDMMYDDPPEPTGPVEDERLRLVFTCCHPALRRRPGSR